MKDERLICYSCREKFTYRYNRKMKAWGYLYCKKCYLKMKSRRVKVKNEK